MRLSRTELVNYYIIVLNFVQEMHNKKKAAALLAAVLRGPSYYKYMYPRG